MSFFEPMTPADILSHTFGREYGYYMFHQQIEEWADFLNTGLWEDGELEQIHELWLANLILEYQSWIGFIDVIPGTIRHFPGMDIFVELCRTYYYISLHEVESQKQQLDDAMFKTTLDETNIHCFKLSHTEHFNDDKTPILQYNQQQVMNCLLMLTEKLDQLPSTAVEETKKVLRLLYIRNAQFICDAEIQTEWVKNFYDPELKCPNRDYLTFCTIYFVAIQRRIFYWDLMSSSKRTCILPEGAVERCQKWIAKEIYGPMTEENFDDLYKKTYEEEAYIFPGDLDWYTYRYPDQPNFQIGPIIECFRKEMASKYFSEYRISKEVLLDSVNQTSHTGHCARLFMINAIDQYISIVKGTVWKDALVINNRDLESATRELLREYGVKVPYFVQIFSRYCVYDVGNIYVTDNFYECFVIWLSLIRDKKNWSFLIDKIIKGHETVPQYQGTF